MHYILAWLVFASAVSHASSWLAEEQPVALTRLIANIHPVGTAPGVVIASPQRHEPNYFYFWTRDAALTMDALIGVYQQNSSPVLENLIRDYIARSLALQNDSASALTGLGEPKFEVDGRPYMGDWGRPQNDGPALRAIAMMHYVRVLQSFGRAIDSALYDSKLPSRSLIKRDLEYVAGHWRDPSFDLWEEVKGDHFYTRMVQRRALVEGSDLARQLGDYGAADWYARQAALLSQEIAKHFDSVRGLILPTLHRVQGADYKNSGIDVAVILGVLHGHTDDGFFSYSDPRVRSSLDRMIEAFAKLYPINSRPDLPGVAIGRYPEDRYDGKDSVGGNPWVLATLAVAEFYLRAGEPNRAEPFIERVKAHANPDGSLAEQISRYNGYMTSAQDLTWNYAAVLTTFAAANSSRSFSATPDSRSH